MRTSTWTIWIGALVVTGCESQAPRIVPESVGVSALELSLPACEASPVPVVDTLASGLDVPWDVAFLDDGRALVTERVGRIRVISREGSLDPEPWAEIPVYAAAGSEVGLMGIDVGPGRDYVYVAGTVREASGNAVTRILRGVGRKAARTLNPERGHAVTLSVFRVAVGERGSVDPSPVVSGVASGYLHGGGALRFGPDGLLYLSNGDAADHWRAQMPTSLRGKILRFGPDGSVPVTNPLPDSPVYASGIRHVQGLAWHPVTGQLLAIDHGPTGMPTEDGRTDNDELNVVTPGANLGWPIVAGGSTGGDLTPPAVVWDPALAPAGLTIYAGDDPDWNGSAFVTGLRGTSLRRIALEVGNDGVRPRCEETLLHSELGRLRLVRQAPDGTVWLGTSNRDGRGLPRPGGDHLLRIRPSPP